MFFVSIILIICATRPSKATSTPFGDAGASSSQAPFGASSASRALDDACRAAVDNRGVIVNIVE